ncbi:hypothetical protein PGQ11_015194 [Apiospora arundinis]|uniref:Uncharacterized protein n=1 Tax=Apiospora arundinis TaxID=335852 RepID=A0ABR2HLU7_9PEZI
MTPKKTYMPVTLEELERRYSTLSLKVLDEQSDRTSRFPGGKVDISANSFKDKKGYSQKPPMKASTKEELIKEIDDLIELCEQTNATADRKGEESRAEETRSKLTVLMRVVLGSL